MSKVYQVSVVGIRGEIITVDLCKTEIEMQKMTVGMLKQKIAAKVKTPVTAEVILKFADYTLEGDFTLLSTYGIKHMSTVVMSLYLPGGPNA